jgi:hypothetical protein
MRRMSRELAAVSASMRAQPVLLPSPSGEETLFDFINEEEVKVGVTSAFSSCVCLFLPNACSAGCGRHRRTGDAAA